ncbi:MFS family permease [Neobacillus niacini]|uniref:MFS transporter n=1 Tax=Neobacillus niacini TaxID=86668 RepID=UPI0028672082|nr:MFS transporter [Neobacillus niacini]MDR7079761.1 MFS family permease [Neobacillus niacini]
MMIKNRWLALTIIGIAVIFCLSLWFSASVFATEIKQSWGLTPRQEALLAASIPTGFVIGAFLSSFFGLADRFHVRRLFAISALLGAILNGFLIMVDQAVIGIVLRILTGVTLAGVYPTSVKMIAYWFPKQRGLATGILIASLTLGSSLPHFISIFTVNMDSRWVLTISSILSIIAAILIISLLPDIQLVSKNSSWSFSVFGKILKNKPVMLVNYGYFGHMWELYAMWTWLPMFLTVSFLQSTPNVDPWLSMFISFVTIGIAGGIGCIAGGIVADKIGRANLTIICMSISAICAILIGFTFGGVIWLTVLISIIWGASVIADSAQFSVGITEFAEADYIGTALTMQMCIGFLITILSINLIPIFQTLLGWRFVFILLSIGPIIGIISMVKFKYFESRVYNL